MKQTRAGEWPQSLISPVIFARYLLRFSCCGRIRKVPANLMVKFRADVTPNINGDAAIEERAESGRNRGVIFFQLFNFVECHPQRK